MPSTWVKVLLSATPVTIPGSAIGRMTRKEIVSRPKKRWRATASEASVPSSSAIAVAASPTLTVVSTASLTPGSFTATPNQWVVRCSGGHFSVMPPLNAYRATTNSGT